MAGRIGVVEEDAFLGQLVDGGSFMELTAIATHVPLPKIIDEEKDDIGFSALLRAKGKTSQQQTDKNG